MLGEYVTRSFFHQRSEKGQASMNYSFIFKKHRSPTAMCLIEQAADNLIDFQAVAKKRLSKFELLNCCRVFQQRSQTDFVSNRELFKRCEFSFQYKTNYCTLELCVCSGAYSILSRKKRCQFDTSQIFRTHNVYNHSTVVVKRSSIYSGTRHK